MAYGRNTFYAPNSGETYVWPVNHSDESAFGKTRNITNGAPTGLTGLIPQQAADSPMVLELTGTIFHAAQHAAMIRWFAISEHQTIYFYDFAGGAYEVVITEFEPVRKRTLRNPRDPSIPLHYWTYTLRMQVVNFLAGPWVGVTP